MSAFIRNLVRRLLQNKFNRNVLVLAGGSALGQVIMLLAMPLVTRLYSAESFGLLAVYGALLSFVAVTVSLRYETAILLPKDDEMAANILLLSLVLALFISLLVGFILWLFGNYCIVLLKVPELKSYFWLLPPGLFCIGAYKIFENWALRYKEAKTIAKTKLIQSVGRVFTYLGFGLIRPDPMGLMLGEIVGQAAGTSNLTLYALRRQGKLLLNLKRPDLLDVAKAYFRFPCFSVPSGILNVAGHQLIPLFLVGMYGPAIGGFFALTQRVMQMPLNLLGASFAKVYFSEAAHLVHLDIFYLRRIFLKITSKLLLIGTLPLIIVFIFGPYLFSIIFGEDWAESGKYAQLLAVAYWFQFVVNPVSQTLNIIKKQAVGLLLDIIRFVCVIGVFGISFFNALKPEQTITLIAITISFTYVVCFFSYWLMIDNFIKSHQGIDGH